MQTDFFFRYKKAHPLETVKQRAFLKLCPYFVKPMKDRALCCCIYHVETILMKEALNRMRDVKLGIHGTHGEYCFCDICCPPGSSGRDDCRASLTHYTGTTQLWESCVCEKGALDRWHRRECLMGTCTRCGVDRKLSFCPSELNPNSAAVVTWRCFERIEIGKDEDGNPARRIKEVYKQTSPYELVQYLKPTLQRFITHNFVARWQDEQSKLALKSLHEGVILSYIDFAENYTFQPGVEVQSEYFTSFTCTILVHITYRVVVNRSTKVQKIVKESHFYISDDKEHDTLFVQHCMLKHWKWLDQHGINPKQHVVFSDGSAAQFKNCRGFYFVCRYPGLTKGCQMKWHFFGTGHGKGKFTRTYLRSLL